MREKEFSNNMKFAYKQKVLGTSNNITVVMTMYDKVLFYQNFQFIPCK